MRISRVHWSAIPLELGPLGMQGPVFAIWPEPVDHDLCFEEAGFENFADTDDEWDKDFAKLVESIFKCLSSCGSPTLVAGELPVRRVGLLRRETGTLADAVRSAATSDEFAPCCIGFGNPPLAHLIVSDGHPLIWLYPGKQMNIKDVLAAASDSWELVVTELKWSVLAPNPDRITIG